MAKSKAGKKAGVAAALAPTPVAVPAPEITQAPVDNESLPMVFGTDGDDVAELTEHDPWSATGDGEKKAPDEITQAPAAEQPDEDSDEDLIELTDENCPFFETRDGRLVNANEPLRRLARRQGLRPHAGPKKVAPVDGVLQA